MGGDYDKIINFWDNPFNITSLIFLLCDVDAPTGRSRPSEFAKQFGWWHWNQVRFVKNVEHAHHGNDLTVRTEAEDTEELAFSAIFQELDTLFAISGRGKRDIAARVMAGWDGYRDSLG